MIGTSKILAVMICCLVLLVGATAQAGTLVTTGPALAYNDTLGPAGGAWYGSAPFASDGLQGYVDWAVYTANTFNANFGGGGYTAPAGELVYAHQIFTVGPIVGSTGMTIFLDGHPAGPGGDFEAGGVSGVDSVSSYADPFIADYILAAETDPLTPSEGLVYSSPNRPQLTGIPIVIDGGQSAETIEPIGIPGPNPIPEPASWLIASLMSALLFVIRRGQRG